MFENLPTAEKVKPTQEVIRADFESRENETIKKGTDFLENLEPEKFKKKAANWLLAFSLFAGATSAFAGEQNADKDNLPSMGEEQIVQGAEKNQTANFDWEKIVGKIEISMGAKKEHIKEFHAESIDSWDTWRKIIAPVYYRDYGYSAPVSRPELFSGITEQDIRELYNFNYSPRPYTDQYGRTKFPNAGDYFKHLDLHKDEFNDLQKAILLQRIGGTLGQSYDYDMLNSGIYVAISDDDMFKSLMEGYAGGGGPKAGLCGNIHTFLTKTAHSMGLEAWLQSGATSGGGHIWSGLILEDGAKKQIVFLDYDTILPTGTLNYQDALGIAERYHKAASVFNNFVGNEKEVLFMVKSRAGEVIEKASGVEGAMERLESNFEKGDTGMEERGVGVKISPEVKEIKLNSDSLGLAFFHFEDASNNPYQSLETLNAWRARARVGNEKFGVETDATVMHMNIKDLYGGTTAAQEVIGRVAVNYVDKKQLTKNEYGEFIAEFGATLEEAIKVPLGERNGSKKTYIENKGEVAFGGGLIYIDPNNIGKFYVRAGEAFGGKSSDFQNQKLLIEETVKNFVVGGEVKVYEGSIVKMNIGTSDTDWGRSFNVGGGVVGEKLSGDVSYEKKTSDFERFIPSSEKIEVSVNYKDGPKWEVDVIGAKTIEKYKDAQSSDIYNAEVKLKIFLW